MLLLRSGFESSTTVQHMVSAFHNADASCLQRVRK